MVAIFKNHQDGNMSQTTVKLGMRLRGDTLMGLKEIALRDRTNMTNILSGALEDYLSNTERLANAFVRRVLDARTVEAGSLSHTAMNLPASVVCLAKGMADRLGISTDALIRVIIEDCVNNQDLHYSELRKEKHAA